MDANTARVNTHSHSSDSVVSELKPIKEKIKEATERGRFYIITRRLTPCSVMYLKDQGYFIKVVEDEQGQEVTMIIWDVEENLDFYYIGSMSL